MFRRFLIVGLLAAFGMTGAVVPAHSQTWEPFGLDSLDIRFLENRGGQLYACVYEPPFQNGRGLYRRDLKEPSAEWVQLGFEGIGLSSVWVHPSDPNLIFVTALSGPARAGVYRSRDGGATWEAADKGLPPGKIWALTGDAAHPTELLVATETGYYRSTDLGDQWYWIKRVRHGGSFAGDVLFDPRRGARLFTESAQRELGEIFSFRPGGPPSACWSVERSHINLLRASPVDGRIYASAGDGIGGVVISDDGGTTWSESPIKPGEEFYALAVAPRRAGQLLTAKLWGEEPVWMSQDGGGSWESLSQGLPPDESIILALEPDNESEGIYYLGLGIHGHGVKRINVDTYAPTGDRAEVSITE
jgi:hypothetical protein